MQEVGQKNGLSLKLAKSAVKNLGNREDTSEVQRPNNKDKGWEMLYSSLVPEFKKTGTESPPSSILAK